MTPPSRHSPDQTPQTPAEPAGDPPISLSNDARVHSTHRAANLDPPAVPACASRDGWTWAEAAVLVVAILVLVGFRLHAYPAPLESDECNYAYSAERMLAGDRLYVDLWDHQPPGIYAALMAVTAAFGSEPAVSRTFALALTLVTLVLVFALARRWFGRWPALVAALLFAIASSDPGMAGEGCNREIHMNALVVAGWWCLAGWRGKGPWRVLLAGALLGLASLIKTVVAFQWLALLPVLWSVHRSAENRRAWWRPAGALAWFAVGPAVLWAAVGLYFAGSGRGAAFIDAVFRFNLLYSKSAGGWWSRLVSFAANGRVFHSALALWLASGAGLVVLLWRRPRGVTGYLGAYVAGAYLAICIPGKFWPHYYLLMLPALVLLVAGLVEYIGRFHRRAGAGLGVLLVVALLATEVPNYLLVPPDDIAQCRYGPRMVWVRDQARRVAEVADPSDTLYVWSNDAGFYYYARRRCASRFTMYTGLLGNDPGSAHRRRLLLEDLEHHRPRLVLIVFSKRHPPFAGLRAFLQRHKYVSVGRTRRMEVLSPLDRPLPRLDWTWVRDRSSGEPGG